MPAKPKYSAPDEKSSQPADARPRLPPLKALLAFEAAARHQSFSQGAEELGVTPSAISHQIQQLEAFLGVQLFGRQAGRATLTSAGHAYANEIRVAVDIIGNATSLVAPQSQSRHLVIASSPSFAGRWLQPRLPDFLNLNPDVRVRLSTLSSAEELSRERCDIAIVYGHPPTMHGRIEPLLVERLRPLCSPTLAAAIGLRVPDDLSRATLIHSANALTWSEYLRRIGKPGVRPANQIWLDRSTMAIDAAASGLGVVLESELLAEEELRDGRLIAPFSAKEFELEIPSYFLVRPAGFRVGTHVAKFERWLRDGILLSKTGQAQEYRVAGLPSTD
jgi:LysR family glycine cleavage system transcriptional activator